MGRIYDWHKRPPAPAGTRPPTPNDPGVLSVTRIYRYYKQFGIATEIMGASFRNVGQILALSGCDLLISPELLNKLAATEGDAPALRAAMAPTASRASLRTRSASAACSTRTPWPRKNCPKASGCSSRTRSSWTR